MFSSFRGTMVTEADSTQRSAKPKRAQVRRACDACRLARAKCDLTRPCRNCKNSGRECVSSGKNEFNAIAPATREVERLRQRVKELEAAQQPPSALLNSPPESEVQEPRVQTQPQAATATGRPWRWTGISAGGLWYGPVSLQFFIRRMSDYLGLDVGTPPPPIAVLSAHNVDLSGCEVLERHQQDYFMDLFWQAYNVSFPVLDEEDFRTLYASLWDQDGRTRWSDPLVDVVLALNIQYAFSFMGLADPIAETDQTEMAVAGSPFYHRCQDALDHLMESPSITTVQCLFFSAVYLSYARCYNAAHTTLKRASHIASTLAVDDADTKSQDLLVRIRRCMRTVDIRLSIKLGRLTPDRTAPIDGEGLVDLSSAAESDWTVYHRQLLRLCEVAEDVYKTFMDGCNQLFETAGRVDFYTNPSTRDECAGIMKDQMKKLHDWAAQVPPSLRARRLSGGEAFSIHRSPVDFNDADPQWLQRQRLILECQYHDLCISLLRMFFHFSPTPDRGTLTADGNCISCVNHAVVMTNLISQAVRETDILQGCYQAFEWQQNAAYALAGFATAYPVCPPTPSARKALSTAREVFESFGTGNTAALRMHGLCGELDTKVSGIIAKFRGGMGAMGLTPRTVPEAPGPASDSSDKGISTESSPDLLGSLWDASMDGNFPWASGQSPLSQEIFGAYMGGT